MEKMDCPHCGSALTGGVALTKGMPEKGLTQEAWFGELNKRAKVEILAK
jgi:hypothetical protein